MPSSLGPAIGIPDRAQCVDGSGRAWRVRPLLELHPADVEGALVLEQQLLVARVVPRPSASNDWISASSSRCMAGIRTSVTHSSQGREPDIMVEITPSLAALPVVDGALQRESRPPRWAEQDEVAAVETERQADRSTSSTTRARSHSVGPCGWSPRTDPTWSSSLDGTTARENHASNGSWTSSVAAGPPCRSSTFRSGWFPTRMIRTPKPARANWSPPVAIRPGARRRSARSGPRRSPRDRCAWVHARSVRDPGSRKRTRPRPRG